MPKGHRRLFAMVLKVRGEFQVYGSKWPRKTFDDLDQANEDFDVLPRPRSMGLVGCCCLDFAQLVVPPSDRGVEDFELISIDESIVVDLVVDQVVLSRPVGHALTHASWGLAFIDALPGRPFLQRQIAGVVDEPKDGMVGSRGVYPLTEGIVSRGLELRVAVRVHLPQGVPDAA